MKDIETTFYQNNEIIAEEVYDASDEPKTKFAVFNKSTKQVTYLYEPQLNNDQNIKPLTLDLILNGKLLLPASADYYQSERKLIEDIEAFINKYLDLPHNFYTKLSAHYILLTWVYDKFSVVPYLRALGDYGSGKTRFAQVIGSICYKPLFLAGSTSDAFIFRMIEIFKGTMVINELERVNTDLQNQITIILNNGYEKGLSIGRVEGEKKREPRMFDVFSPKIITTRQKFKDLALESRIISIPMKPTKRKDIPTILTDGFWTEAQELRNMLLMYRFNNLCSQELDNKEEKLFGLEPRLKQTLLPLLYVIQSDEVLQEFVEYAKQFQEQVISDRGMETDALVAEKLIDLLENNERVGVKDVWEVVNKELEEKEQLTSKAIGKKIRDFGFQTKRIQGVYKVVPNDSVAVYLKERYGLWDEESPLTPPSPHTESDSEGDLVDLGDIDNSEQVLVDGGEISGS